MLNKREEIEKAIYLDLENCFHGYWVTLNTLGTTKYSLEFLVAELSKRLNRYCYGRSFIQNSTAGLRIVGVVERGSFNQGLHIHLLIMEKISCSKSLVNIDLFIRKNWYQLIGANGSFYGILVDVQPVGDLESRIKYMCKTCWCLKHDFNPIYF